MLNYIIMFNKQIEMEDFEQMEYELSQISKSVEMLRRIQQKKELDNLEELV